MRLKLEIEVEGEKDVTVFVDGGRLIKKTFTPFDPPDSPDDESAFHFDRDEKTIRKSKIVVQLSSLELELLSALMEAPQTLPELCKIWGDPLLIWDNINSKRMKLNRKIAELGLVLNRRNNRLILSEIQK